jgi:hypothetical protein
MIRFACASSLALLTLGVSSVQSQQAPTGGAAPTIPARWDVSARRTASKDLTFETSTGTFMSLDISPDGRTIVFDLLGDIYTMPITGGNATLSPRRTGVGDAAKIFARWATDRNRVRPRWADEPLDDGPARQRPASGLA